MYLSNKAKNCSPSSTLAIDAKFKEMKANGQDVVGFGTGEPDFDTPQYIKDAAIEALNKGMTKYTPASGTIDLKNAVCRKFKRENGLEYAANQIVISNGAKHSLMNVFTAICNDGDEVILPGPYWVSYPEMIKLAGGVPVEIYAGEDKNFKVTADDIKSLITDKTRAIVLNSPSNPTGMVYDRAELQDIADLAVKHNLYVISDEVYEHLVYDGKEHISIASLGEEIKALTIVVNAVSKTYAMTGWRIGYTASCKELATAMSNIQSHATSNPNSIAQHASITALDNGLEYVYMMKDEFIKRKNYMVSEINKIDGVSCLMPEGAFYVMMNIKELKGSEICGKIINTSDDFADLFLEKQGVAVVPGSGFMADNYVRWSYAASMDTIQKGIERLKALLK